MRRLLFVTLLALALMPMPAHADTDCLCKPTCSCDSQTRCPWIDCQADASGNYDAAYNQAVAANKPLVVFVNQTAQPVPNAVAVSVPNLPGISSNVCAVVSVPDGKGGFTVLAEMYGPVSADRIVVILRDQRPPVRAGLAVGARLQIGVGIGFGVGIRIGGCCGGHAGSHGRR